MERGGPLTTSARNNNTINTTPLSLSLSRPAAFFFALLFPALAPRVIQLLPWGTPAAAFSDLSSFFRCSVAEASPHSFLRFQPVSDDPREHLRPPPLVAHSHTASALYLKRHSAASLCRPGCPAPLTFRRSTLLGRLPLARLRLCHTTAERLPHFSAPRAEVHATGASRGAQGRVQERQ